MGCKTAFSEIKKKSEESLRLYSTRIERAFTLAYPRRNVELSKLLRDKFLSTVPTKFGKQLENAIAINKMMTGNSIKWSHVTALAAHVDTRFTPIRAPSDSDWDTERNPHMMWLATADQTEFPRKLSEHGRKTSNQPLKSAQRQVSPPIKRDATSQCTEIQEERSPLRQHIVKPNSGQEVPDRDSYCSYCKRVGHGFANCRRRLGQCLVCGSGHHRVANCPERTPYAQQVGHRAEQNASASRSRSVYYSTPNSINNTEARPQPYSGKYTNDVRYQEQPLNPDALTWRGTSQS